MKKVKDIFKFKKQPAGLVCDVNPPSAYGSDIITVKNLTKQFMGIKAIDDLTVNFPQAKTIGLIGANGSGKTTLIKLLTKRLESDSGFVRIGKNLEEAYFDQNRDTLNPQKTLWKTLCDEGDHIWVNGHFRHVVAYLKDFLFKPEQAQSPVSSLSGGEKNRLMLALALAHPSNLLVLDEPTNDLDMDTLDLLQEVLDEYEGTILIVSHDRDFMDKVATSLLYMRGDGSIYEHVGSYSELWEKVKGLPQQNIVKKNKDKTNDVKIKKHNKTSKLSYKEQYLLDNLPIEIADLEQQNKAIEIALSNPNLYTDDAQKFDELTTALAYNKEKIEQLENQWFEIQSKAECLENQP